jgi:hypothetical protein
MGEERQAILLTGGKEADVVPDKGAPEFLAQALGGAPSRAGVATLRMDTNTTGEPLVTVVMGSRRVGFLRPAEAENVLPAIANYEYRGVEARAKIVVAVSPSDPGRAVMTLSLPAVEAPLAATQTPSEQPAAATSNPAASIPAGPALAASAPWPHPATAGPAAAAWTPAGPALAASTPAAPSYAAGPRQWDSPTPIPGWQPVAQGSALSPTPARWTNAPQQSWLKRNPWVWRIATAVVVAVVAWVVISTLTGGKFDHKQTFLWGELYYTDQVEKVDAQKLGAFWETTYDTGDQEFTLALDKTGSTFELSMILQDEDKFNPQIPEVMAALGESIAAVVFPGSNVSILLCNETFDPYDTYGPFGQIQYQ